MNILKSVHFQIPNTTLLDEALRKLKLIEEDQINQCPITSNKDLKKKLTTLCIKVTQYIEYF